MITNKENETLVRNEERKQHNLEQRLIYLGNEKKRKKEILHVRVVCRSLMEYKEHQIKEDSIYKKERSVTYFSIMKNSNNLLS